MALNDMKKKEKSPDGNKSGRKLRISRKAIALLVIAAAVIIAVIIGVNQLRKWHNDGARYAEKLSEQIGVSPKTAQKYAKVTLSEESDCPYINMVMEQEGYSYVYESSQNVSVSGVTIPEWVVLLTVKNTTVTEVVYYDYKELKQYGNGHKAKDHISFTGINAGMDSAAVQAYTGFAPLCVRYDKDTMTEYYKYYYKDQNTENTVSYILSVTYRDGLTTEAKEEANYFLLSVLTVD